MALQTCYQAIEQGINREDKTTLLVAVYFMAANCYSMLQIWYFNSLMCCLCSTEVLCEVASVALSLNLSSTVLGAACSDAECMIMSVILIPINFN